ncbi:MAG: hypothetical protein Q7S66_01795 [bacterium]|nr:hypothetical protein [bacterium]
MIHHNAPFAGDKKVGTSLFGPWEQMLVKKYTAKIPKSIETYHLTLSTLLWCALIIIFSYLAQYNIHWMWGTSIMIVFQYITDLFDGAVGRLRDTGLVRWGYYMDHFLDFIFLCSILIGYAFLFNDEYNSQFFILAIYGAFMVNSYLSFAATNKFTISYFKIGPTEARLAFIIVNTIIIGFHSLFPLAKLLPIIFWLAFIGLIIVVYRTQKIIWQEDMENKLQK